METPVFRLKKSKNKQTNKTKKQLIELLEIHYSVLPLQPKMSHVFFIGACIWFFENKKKVIIIHLVLFCSIIFTCTLMAPQISLKSLNMYKSQTLFISAISSDTLIWRMQTFYLHW